VKSRLDLAVSDLGETKLKNIAEPIRVYSLQCGNSIAAKATSLAGGGARIIASREAIGRRTYDAQEHNIGASGGAWGTVNR
jgi:hypothetical protein